MPAKSDRTAVAEANDIRIVEATADESPDYWLVSGEGGAEFPVQLDQLHDIMHTLHQLHDQAHHH